MLGWAWISLMTSDVEHPFMFLLIIHISSFSKCTYKEFAHLIGLSSWVIEVLYVLGILECLLSVRNVYREYFLWVRGLSFQFLHSVLPMPEDFNSDKAQSSVHFFFWLVIFVHYLRNMPSHGYEGFLLRIHQEIFVWAFRFRSLLCFK